MNLVHPADKKSWPFAQCFRLRVIHIISIRMILGRGKARKTDSPKTEAECPSMRFDIILQGGRVIDPAASRDGIFDVGVSQGKIAAIGGNLPADTAQQVYDVAGKIVLPGMIDTHSHVYEHVTGKFGLNADMVGVQSGVTTVVDQGGPSCMTLPGFRAFIARPSKTRVLCFISTYLVGGLEGHYYPELYGPEQVNVAHTVRVARENPDLVRGIKAHAEIGGASRWGLDVIKLGKQIAREAKLPLYIHLGQLWPEKDGTHIDADELVRELITLMDEGDVLAHPFTRHPGGFISTKTGDVHPVVWAALERGVTVDVGHGSHFSFDMARQVIAAGIKPYTLGADMHGYNVKVASADADRTKNPFFGVAPFNLTNAMSKILHLGMSLSEVIATVTSNPAKMLGMADSIGTIAVGRDADISVIEILDGAFDLSDNSGVSVTASQMIVPAFCLRAGDYHAASSPLVPPALEKIAA
jgi:dihydroorotase